MPDQSPQLVPDIRRIYLRRIKAGSFFKLVFISTTAALAPLIVLCGVCALFGFNTITVSGRHLTGVTGLVAALIMAPLFSALVSLFVWFFGYLGLRLWGHFRPVSLEYVPASGADF